MLRRDAIGGDVIYVEIVLSIASQLQPIQIESIPEQYVGGGGSEVGWCSRHTKH